MDSPPPLVQAISTDAYQRLDELHGGFQNKPVTVWLDGWHAMIQRFYEESSLPRDRWTDMTRHRHDWVGALHLRTILQRDLQDLQQAIPAEVTAWVDLVDNFMRGFTEEVEGWVTDEDTPEGWWWLRLPTFGPVRAGWWADE